MAGFLYYLAGRGPGFSLADVAAAGIAHAFERPPDQLQVIGGGPDGGAGLVLCEPGTVPRIGVYLEEQTWRPLAGGAWLGWYTAEPPGPADLARAEQLPGHEVELGDGRRWLVPVARRLLERDGRLQPVRVLPRRHGYTAEAGWVRDRPVERYALLWELAERWWDVFIASVSEAGDDDSGAGSVSGEGDPAIVAIDFQQENATALAALAANYRLGAWEIDALGLFDDTSVSEVLGALIDRPTLAAFQKKTSSRRGT